MPKRLGAVTVGCNLKPALAVRATVAGHWLGALQGEGGHLPPFRCIPEPGSPSSRSVVLTH